MSIELKKLNLFDIHDKHEYFTKQSFGIAECVERIIASRPFGDRPFYIFAHARTRDTGFGKNILWQPRLSKPSCETNSMLFRVKPESDEVEIVWIVPDSFMWEEYEKGKVCESPIVAHSIAMFKSNRKELEKPHPEDLNEEQIRIAYKELLQEKKKKEASSKE